MLSLTFSFRRLRAAGCVLLLLAAAGCWRGSKGTPPPAPMPAVDVLPQVQHLPAAPVTDTVYTVGPFDRLQIRVWQYPDLSGERLVKEDGTLYLPAVGHIPVEGQTLRQAQETVRMALSKVIKDPQVDLDPIEIRSKVYTVLGAVQQPGRYPLFRQTRLSDAVALAGGTLPGAALARSYLGRDGETYTVNLRTVMMRGEVPLHLAVGDTLYIPPAQDRRVYVMGAVQQPGAVEVAGSGFDLLAAIASAGGMTMNADADAVAVLRPGPEGMFAYRVDFDDALELAQGDPAQLALQPGDIVYVPTSVLGSWNEIIAQIAPTLNTLVYQPLSAGRDYFIIEDLLNR